jgi:sulfatase maturation enzyme AslB (radical SAM superfamily)
MKTLPIIDVDSAPQRGRRLEPEELDRTLGTAPPWPHQPTVEWQVVGHCNYDCSYCIQSKKHRQGIVSDAALRRAIRALAALPPTLTGWEVKTTGGEPFSFRGFLDVVVPALMNDTPHRMGTLTNLSAPSSALQRFASLTRGRLSIVSASLHLEHTDVMTFLSRLRVLRDHVEVNTKLVVNCVLVPERLADVAAAQDVVVDAGFRFFPQLMKVKGGVFAYSPAQWRQVLQIIGDPVVAARERSANLAPAYTNRRCFAGARYVVITKTGDAWSCRTAKRHGEGWLGNVYRDDDDAARFQLLTGARACPYTICPCVTPANRGMIEGIQPRSSIADVEEA